MIDYKILIVIALFSIILLLQHVIHEYSHIHTARFYGVKVTKIQWFTYPKLFLGTRVFYEDEPRLDEKSIEKKWGWISIAGFVITTVIGYVFTAIGLLFHRYMGNWLTLTICLFSMIFLTADPIYFTLGSILGYGDITGFRKVFRIGRSTTILFSLLILFFNVLLIRLAWYGSPN